MKNTAAPVSVLPTPGHTTITLNEAANEIMNTEQKLDMGHPRLQFPTCCFNCLFLLWSGNVSLPSHINGGEDENGAMLNGAELT